MALFAEVILPLPLYNTYTYSVPETLAGISIGCRVLVQFGRRKCYTAIVASLHSNKPEQYEVKEILAKLDDGPIVKHPQLKFWDWIANYYLCSTGEVYKAAVPASLKIESETVVSANSEYEEVEPGELTQRERIILDFVASRDKVQLSELSQATGFNHIEATISKMIDKGAIHIAERIVDNYRPKTETCVTLTIEQSDSDGLHHLFDLTSGSKRQEALLLAFLDLSHWLQRSQRPAEVTKKMLLERANAGQALFAAAQKKGIFSVYKKQISRFSQTITKPEPLPTLTDEQQQAYRQILESWRGKNVTLLHGVTSSGKTSVYIHLINDTLRLKRQALYLVPEIALTTQLTQRLRKVFGNKLLIYHSRFSDNERVDIWQKLLRIGEPCVVIGVRSAVFLPFTNLGLVIVDEEHDTSYKQQDPAPRYNGRNVAIVLAQMHGAKTLLGSATPAIETYYNAKTGKYALVEMPNRYEGIEMPEIEIVDTKKARKEKTMTGTFSGRLIAQCRDAVKQGQQVILFQNRRGYSPMVACKQCGWVPKCINCDVSLTYHKHLHSLNCHYCGYTLSLPNICPACQQPTIEIVGYGTERVEERIEELFPDCKILRMDLDTTRNKNSYERIIDDFSQHKADILIGTQMVTKGLNFDSVSTVGILNADTLINFPDFRSHERAFNMMEQVAGRAGRKGKRGKVIIQTSVPDNPAITFVQTHDYAKFYDQEIEERRRFLYPPFTKLITIYLKHRNDDLLNEVAVRYSGLLRQIFGKRVLGPEPPMVARVQNLFIRQIVLKMENEASMKKVKAILRDVYQNAINIDSRIKSVILYYDVD